MEHTQADLETLFDTSVFESNLVGYATEFNAKHISCTSHPYLNGRCVTVIKRLDVNLNILELEDTNKGSAERYKYIAISDALADRIDAIEPDAYNDAAYADNLLDIAYDLFHGC